MATGLYHNDQLATVGRPLTQFIGVTGVIFGLIAYHQPGAFGPLLGPTADVALFTLVGTAFCIASVVDLWMRDYPLVCRADNHDYQPDRDLEGATIQVCSDCGDVETVER